MKNLFEVENAKNLSPEDLSRTFVVTKDFTRLLSRKHHIVLGSRGSGKTAMVRMLSHGLLRNLSDKWAKKIIDSKEFIGIYVPTKLEWVGSLKNKPWKTEEDNELFFQWRLNITSCQAFITTLKSCIREYSGGDIHAIENEIKISKLLSNLYFKNEKEIFSLDSIQKKIKDLEGEMHEALAKKRVLAASGFSMPETGMYFHTDLFFPLRSSIDLVTEILRLQNSTWLLCIDEAEFLDTLHHRILNSFLRTDSDKIFFKITTMPYCHYTLETNTSVPLNEGHDFEYIYINSDPVADDVSFAQKIFKKRANRGYVAGISLKQLFGQSELLDKSETENWGSESKVRSFLLKYANEETIARAKELNFSGREFSDQIGRKIKGILYLRSELEETTGRGELSCYSGEKLVIRCGDGNPRRIVQILNRFVRTIDKNVIESILKGISLDKKLQSRELAYISTSTLNRVRSEKEVGSELFRMLSKLGDALKHLMAQKISTDVVSSINIPADISDYEWKLVEKAVGVGLLFPNVNVNSPDDLPIKEGTFRVAYVLAPKFHLLPRRGSARDLRGLLSGNELGNGPEQQQLNLG